MDLLRVGAIALGNKYIVEISRLQFLSTIRVLDVRTLLSISRSFKGVLISFIVKFSRGHVVHALYRGCPYLREFIIGDFTVYT